MWIVLLTPFGLFGLACNMISSIILACRSRWYFGIAAFAGNLIISFLGCRIFIPKNTDEGSWIGLLGFAVGAIMASIAITIFAFEI